MADLLRQQRRRIERAEADFDDRQPEFAASPRSRNAASRRADRSPLAGVASSASTASSRTEPARVEESYHDQVPRASSRWVSFTFGQYRLSAMTTDSAATPTSNGLTTPSPPGLVLSPTRHQGAARSSPSSQTQADTAAARRGISTAKVTSRRYPGPLGLLRGAHSRLGCALRGRRPGWPALARRRRCPVAGARDDCWPLTGRCAVSRPTAP